MTTSTKKVTFIIPLLLGLALAASPAQAQLGAAVGYGLNMLNEPSFSSPATNTFEGNGGFNLGIFYDVKFGRLGFRPGLFYQQTNFDWSHSDLFAAWNPLKASVRTASFPLDVLFYIPLQSVSPYVVVGPGLTFLHTDQPDLRQALDRSKGSTNFWSLNFGVGAELRAPNLGLRLLPEIRYSYALSGFMLENYIVRTFDYHADGSPRMSGLTFRLGVSFLSIE